MATDTGEVLFAKMRPDLESFSPQSTDESFMQLGPMLLSGVCERLVPWAGPLESVVSTYGKVALIVTKLKNRYLALTISRPDASSLGEVMEKLQELFVQ